MKKKILNKAILSSLKESKGRFLSILCLMMLGSFALVGLKVSGPDIQETVHQYLEKYHTADIFVLADYGLSPKDQEELREENAEVEFGYFVDTVIADNPKAIRVFSKTAQQSEVELVSGAYPSHLDEVVLDEQLSNRYQIGDSINLNEVKSPLLLKQHEFKITGFAHSSEILSKNSKGVSTAGSGDLSGFAIVPQESFDSSVYTIARLRYPNLRSLKTFSGEYLDEVVGIQQSIEEKLSDNGTVRLNDLKEEADGKIQDGEEQISQAKNQLEEGKTKLEDGQQQIANQEGKLVQSQNELAQNQDSLNRGSQEVQQAKHQLQSQFELLEANRVQLESAKQTLDQQNSALEEGKKKLAEAEKQLESQKEKGLPQTALSAMQEKILQQKQELDAGTTAYEQGLTQYENGWASYQEGLKQYQEGLAIIQSKQNMLDAGQRALAEGKRKISAGEEAVAKAKQEIEEKQNQYTDEKEKAEEKIGQAKTDLEDAKVKASKLTKPRYSVYTRSTMLGSEGYLNMKSTAEGIIAVANLFPVVLYAVAALVTVTTMTRFVNEERMNAGILKALGYSTFNVMKKFAFYGFSAGMIGTIIGIGLGTYFLPSILGVTLLKETILPSISLLFNLRITIVALLCSIGCSVIPPVWIAYRELKESSASLLLPKAPSVGSKIWLEYVPFIWKRFSFTQKVTARNIFRYKQRMLMTIFGVAGSVALLFAGRGILSSLSGISHRQFGEIITYDAIVVKEAVMTGKEQEALSQLLSTKEIEHYSDVHSETIATKIAGVHEEQSLTILVGEEAELSRYLHLYDVKTKRQKSLTNDGVFLSEKLAQLLNVHEGETVRLPIKDGVTKEMVVSGIIEMYAGHFMIMSPTVYETLAQETPTKNASFVSFKEKDVDSVRKMSAQLLAQDGVKAVVQNTSMIHRIETIVGSLSRVMILLTIVSVLLAIVILYNLTTINVAERIRELSTIKVLGFLNREVTLYIYRETMVLSLIGIGVGLLLGKVLHRVIIEAVAPAFVRFNPQVGLDVYIWPCIFIVLILAVLGILVNHMLKKVDMLEALKSVD